MIREVANGVLVIILAKFVLNDVPHAARFLSGKPKPDVSAINSLIEQAKQNRVRKRALYSGYPEGKRCTL